MKALKATLHLNLAACYVKLKNWDLVLSNCTEGLILNPKSAKAFFFRSQYHENKKDMDKALEDMIQCQSYLDKADKLVSNSIDRLKKLVQNEKDKEKKVWSKAFS